MFEPISKIIVQTPEVFKNTIKNCKEVCKAPHYCVDNGQIAASNIYTQFGNTCSELGLSNGKNVYIGHFAPEYRKADFLDKLDCIIKSFQDATGKLSAFLTGAYDYLVSSRLIDAKASFRLNSDIASLLDRNKVPLTMISGKINPIFTDSLAVTKDAFILSHSKKAETAAAIPKFPNNPTDIQIQEVLETNYRVFEPDESHKLYFEG